MNMRKIIALLMLSMVAGSGCCLISDCIDDVENPQFPEEFIREFTPKEEYTHEGAVNHMATALSIKCVMMFGGQPPFVVKELHTDQDVFNMLPDKVFSQLVQEHSFRPYFKQVTPPADFTLKSTISISQGRIWNLKLISNQEDKVVWEETLKLAKK